jgi:single-stranded-DNA-specific exonuclease
MAAGLTIEPGKIEALATFLANALAADCLRSSEGKVLTFDGAISPGGATEDLCTLIARCGPYGAGNPEPLFALPSVRVAFASIVGEQHVRCTLASADGARIQGIAFRALQSELGPTLLNSQGRPLHVAASLKAEEWNGNTRVQAMIRDAAFAQ